MEVFKSDNTIIINTDGFAYLFENEYIFSLIICYLALQGLLSIIDRER